MPVHIGWWNKMGHRWYTYSFKEQVVKEREQGMPVKDLAEKYKISQYTVRKWTSDYHKGILRKREGDFTTEEKDEAVLRYLNGMHKKDISQEYRISVTEVDEWIDEYFMRKEQECKTTVHDEKNRRFKERHKIQNGKLLRVVYPTSSSAYVDWGHK